MRGRPALVSFFLRRAAAPVSGTAFALLVAGAVVLSSSDAGARSTYESLYGYDRTWNAALRMVRVDMSFKVDEKDEKNGYLLFEYTSPEGGNRSTPGSFEFVHDDTDPQSPVEVIVQLPQMPRYHEQVLVDSLVHKMRQEYGDPPEHRPAPAPPPAADGGTPDAG